MENNEKIHTHPLRRVFYDLLRDGNSLKYSMTKFAALVGVVSLVATTVMSLIIMWQNKIIDHVLIVELIGFVLTLLGFKNNFGIKSRDTTITAGSGDISNDAQKILNDNTNDQKS